MEHKSNGKARYAIQDAEEHLFNVADKQVRFSAGCPASPKDEAAVFKDIMAASQASPAELRAKLDLDAEVLELAWEEVAASEDGLSTVTAKDFVELVHSRPPKSAGEAYCAWYECTLPLPPPRTQTAIEHLPNDRPQLNVAGFFPWFVPFRPGAS